MNKKTTLVTLLLFTAICGYSQISWNAKAGVNLSRISNYGYNIDMKLGYQVGIGMDYFFNDHWGLQPSLMLISKGYKEKGDYRYPPEWNSTLSKYDILDNRVYLEMPVMLAYKFSLTNNLKLVVNGGGFISYGIGGNYRNKYTTKDGTKYKDKSKTFYSGGGVERFDAGLGAGTTLEIANRYLIGLIGEWGLTNTSGEYKNQTYGLSIGYKF